ncbi:MAG: ABC transporter permease [Planctomycetota bacterium]|jgi:ABC-type polysaccharide/polyol phosphate export permease
MLQLFRSLLAHRALLRDFIVRDLKARYVGSAMGFFWSLVFPVVNLFVFMFVFRLVLKARWGDTGGAGDYPGDGSPGETALVMLAGILAWSAFSETISRGTNALVENANLIKKVVFPSEILPPYLTVSSLVNMMIGVPIVLAGVVVFTDKSLAAPLMTIPLLLLLQGLFTIGLAYLLATLNAMVRDVYHVIGVALTVWMFATPIFYPAQMVADSFQSLGGGAGGFLLPLGIILEVNPMHWLIDSWQRVLVFQLWPQWDLVARFALATLLILVIGAGIFRDQRRTFPDLL